MISQTPENAVLTSRYGLEIRAATAADAPGLAALLTEAGHHIPPQDIAARLDSLHALPGTALIALEWGPPSGLAILHWFQTLTAPRPTALITTLFVAADSRRKGLGRLLVKAASQAARVAGCDALSLLAAEPELAAFCAATGFAPNRLGFRKTLAQESRLARLSPRRWAIPPQGWQGWQGGQDWMVCPARCSLAPTRQRPFRPRRPDDRAAAGKHSDRRHLQSGVGSAGRSDRRWRPLLVPERRSPCRRGNLGAQGLMPHNCPTVRNLFLSSGAPTAVVNVSKQKSTLSCELYLGIHT